MQDLLHVILLPSSGKILKIPLFLEILRNFKRIFWFCIKQRLKNGFFPVFFFYKIKKSVSKGFFSGIFFYCRISQDWFFRRQVRMQDLDWELAYCRCFWVCSWRCAVPCVKNTTPRYLPGFSLPGLPFTRFTSLPVSRLIGEIDVWVYKYDKYERNL